MLRTSFNRGLDFYTILSPWFWRTPLPVVNRDLCLSGMHRAWMAKLRSVPSMIRANALGRWRRSAPHRRCPAHMHCLILHEKTGFGVRAYAGGSKVYVVQTRAGGKAAKRVTVGRHGVITAEEARRRAALKRRDPRPLQDELEYVRSLLQAACDSPVLRRDCAHRFAIAAFRCFVLRLPAFHLVGCCMLDEWKLPMFARSSRGRRSGKPSFEKRTA